MASWWEDLLSGNIVGLATDVGEGTASAIGDWLGGIGGSIASGIESGMVAIFGDIWDVIVGPVYVIIGVIIVVVTLGYAFKNQLIQLGGLALAAAA